MIYFGNPSQNYICTIFSLNNTAINCLTPAYPFDQTVQITIVLNAYNFSVNSTYNFTSIQTPTIQTFYPKSSSPVLKSLLTIQGLNFQLPANVYLTDINGENIYDCSIISSNRTTILCILSGGHIGKFRIKVISEKGVYDYQNKTEQFNLFEYRITILSMIPLSGSVLGGTLLTVLGENFSPNSGQNQMVLLKNDGDNVICDLIFYNSSCLKCLTRPFLQEGNTTVKVLGRLIENAECLDSKSSCYFIFSLQSTPVVNNDINATNSYYNGEMITLKGSLLDGKANIYLNNSECVVISQNESIILFKIPEISFGLYYLTVKIENRGYAIMNDFHLNISVNVSELDVKTTYKSGALLNIIGSGFKSTTDFAIVLAAKNGDIEYCTVIDEITTKLIKCVTDELFEDQDYLVSLRLDDKFYTCSNCYFTVKKPNIGSVAVISSLNQSEINEEIGE